MTRCQNGVQPCGTRVVEIVTGRNAFYYPHLWPGACLNMALDTPGFV